jgi:hypothetical protein
MAALAAIFDIVMDRVVVGRYRLKAAKLASVTVRLGM